MSERARFEKWAKSRGCLAAKQPDGTYASWHCQSLWRAWKAARAWRPIEEAPHNTLVLVHYKNRLGKSRIVRAEFIPRFTVESGPDAEHGIDEYDEANDRYTYIEGWWEHIDNWAEYAFVLFDSGHKPDGWQALPPPPEPTGSA